MKREYQPAVEMANNFGNKIKIPVDSDLLIKLKETPELKNIEVFEERIQLLEDALTIKESIVEGKNILLFDDLFRSGATLQVTTKLLRTKGRAKNIYVLALTKTRSRL